MKYRIDKAVFDILPTVCVGTICVRGVDNRCEYPEISELLARSIASCEAAYENIKVKEAPEIVCYREAFRALGINPNKYMCSIEALISRIAKKKGMPSINPLVDLNNAISIKYSLPMGTHDLDTLKGDLLVRFSQADDTFIPFGETESEKPDENEIVYVSGNEVRTRRWTWRQSEIGKITEETSAVFFPIDGFTNINKDRVIRARDELAELIEKIFGVIPVTGYTDKDNPETELC